MPIPTYTLMTGLKQARKAAGYTQTELGRHLGVCLGAVSSWETGRNLPSIPTLFAMADLLGVAPTDLMPSLAHRLGALEAALGGSEVES